MYRDILKDRIVMMKALIVLEMTDLQNLALNL